MWHVEYYYKDSQWGAVAYRTKAEAITWKARMEDDDRKWRRGGTRLSQIFTCTYKIVVCDLGNNCIACNEAEFIGDE